MISFTCIIIHFAKVKNYYNIYLYPVHNFLRTCKANQHTRNTQSIKQWFARLW